MYVFGGGWMLGANTQTTSNASGLAATGRAVGVSINYRLGAFGALSLSQYGGALAEATNLSLQDIIAALRWVKENIARFGGDPNNVTVTGHSAGAFSALSLLAAPSADGLYHHLAAFSGMPSRQVPAWGAEERAHAVLTALGLQDDPEQLLTVDADLLAETTAKTQSSDPVPRTGWTTTSSPSSMTGTGPTVSSRTTPCASSSPVSTATSTSSSAAPPTRPTGGSCTGPTTSTPAASKT